MENLLCVLTSFASIIILFLVIKVIGNKSITQLTMFDYVNGITIGSIAAEMATEVTGNIVKPLIAVIVYGTVAFFLALLTDKSVKVRRFVSGKSIVLLKNGKLYRDNFKKGKIDINDFLMLARVSGYFDISKIECALLEPNGMISFLEKSAFSPLAPNDVSLKVQRESLMTDLILDGNILENNLKYSGKDRAWLNNQLKAKGYKNENEVFLASVDENNNFIAYGFDNYKKNGDLFQ